MLNVIFNGTSFSAMLTVPFSSRFCWQMGNPVLGA
jgi:hypothetical protein